MLAALFQIFSLLSTVEWQDKKKLSNFKPAQLCTGR
jgi:hypothetical protein